MAIPKGNGITIINFKAVLKHLENLDLTDKKNIKETRTTLKKPFLSMRSDAKTNLSAQRSVRNDNLKKGLSVGSKFSKAKGYITVAFGGRSKAINKGKKQKRKTNHFHLVNSGTKVRYHKSWKKVGAVGRAKTKGHKLMNYSFKLGFADRAIKPWLPRMKDFYTREFQGIINKVKTAGV